MFAFVSLALCEKGSWGGSSSRISRVRQEEKNENAKIALASSSQKSRVRQEEKKINIRKEGMMMKSGTRNAFWKTVDSYGEFAD